MIIFRVRVTKYHIRDLSNGDSDVGDVFLMFLTELLVSLSPMSVTNIKSTEISLGDSKKTLSWFALAKLV